MFDQVIVSLDSVKPLDNRRGWTVERVAEYNRSRFEDLITAGWEAGLSNVLPNTTVVGSKI